MAKRAVLAAVSLLAAALLTSARAQDISPCARFQDPFAYNACLASHGPKAGAVGKVERESAGPADGKPRSSRAPVVLRRRGRVHMEFQVR